MSSIVILATSPVKVKEEPKSAEKSKPVHSFFGKYCAVNVTTTVRLL